VLTSRPAGADPHRAAIYELQGKCRPRVGEGSGPALPSADDLANALTKLGYRMRAGYVIGRDGCPLSHHRGSFRIVPDTFPARIIVHACQRPRAVAERRAPLIELRSRDARPLFGNRLTRVRKENFTCEPTVV
jgi:hypothetical protein